MDNGDVWKKGIKSDLKLCVNSSVTPSPRWSCFLIATEKAPVLQVSLITTAFGYWGKHHLPLNSDLKRRYRGRWNYCFKKLLLIVTSTIPRFKQPYRT